MRVDRGPLRAMRLLPFAAAADRASLALERQTSHRHRLILQRHFVI